ncbi:helix-turn-helix transcriptional regulator [Azospirillum cavernae]|uniref:helix-turn-helix transcriptional regulator n=1 Tax=Azospirillum cavernae TaxID=2320860 RepID=UPI0011C3C2F1|nr:response regulator transcription factor [Azospirillum cavernae]
MDNLPLPSDLNLDAILFIRASQPLGGAVLVYSPTDQIIWANGSQRRIAPVSDYTSETHESLFWKLLEAGLIGNRVAVANPADWISNVRIARRLNTGLDWISEYPSGRMSVSHRLYGDGTCVQSRVCIQTSGVENYINTKIRGNSFEEMLTVNDFLNNMHCSLNLLDLAVGIFDVNMNRFHLNDSFIDLISSETSMMFDDFGRIRATDPDDCAKLDCAVSSAATLQDFYKVLPLSYSGGVHFASISSGQSLGTAIIVISRFGEDDAAIASALERALGLHPAEARVAALIGSGLGPGEIARRRSTSEATVYTQIRNIKDKLRGTKFAAGDLTSLAALVFKISAITRAKMRKS